ncbi:MAG: adenosine deaminase [Dehalococcoidia bacterium]
MTRRPAIHVHMTPTHINITNWCHSLPKVELHLHLEGAIPIPALWEIVQKYGGDPLIPDEAALRKYFKFRDFPHFIELWIWKNSFLREYDDFEFFSAAVARALKTENIKYIEAFFSPSRFKQGGLNTGRMIEAVRAGLDSVTGVEVALIPDLVRDVGPDYASGVLDELSELRSLGLIGIGLGGSEHAYPPELFTDLYSRARNSGFHTTAHAGEAAGAESVWGAINTLQVERIGHGIRAIEDPELMRHLAETQLPIEMCPLSNVATGVVDSITAHPIRQFLDQGVLVPVNSDDPAMFGNSLTGDYAALMSELAFTPDEIRQLILNAIESSWLVQDRKTEFKDMFTQASHWREDPGFD